MNDMNKTEITAAVPTDAEVSAWSRRFWGG